MSSYSLLSMYFSISLEFPFDCPVWYTWTPVPVHLWSENGFPPPKWTTWQQKKQLIHLSCSIWNTTPNSSFQMSGKAFISPFLFLAGHLSVMDQWKLCNASSWPPETRSVWVWQSPKYFILKNKHIGLSGLTLINLSATTLLLSFVGISIRDKWSQFL